MSPIRPLGIDAEAILIMSDGTRYLIPELTQLIQDQPDVLVISGVHFVDGLVTSPLRASYLSRFHIASLVVLD